MQSELPIRDSFDPLLTKMATETTDSEKKKTDTTIKDISVQNLDAQSEQKTSSPIKRAIKIDSEEKREPNTQMINRQNELNKAENSGKEALGIKQKSWKNSEYLSQLTAQRRENVAEKMWARSQKDPSQVDGLLKMFFGLSEDQCIKVLKDKTSFKNLFKNLEKEPLDFLTLVEKVDHFPSTHVITIKDLRNLEKHIKDTEFSGVIGIFDGKSTHFVKSENQASMNVPFPIHSIGKTFTGVLALKMIEETEEGEGLLSKPISLLLEPEVIDQLPPRIQKYLEEDKPSLKQVMLHTSGLGDYLDHYMDAVDIALLASKDKNEVINNPQDLLEIAKNNFFQPSAFNIGLLSLAYLQKEKVDEKTLNFQIDISLLEEKMHPEEYKNILKLEQPLTLQKIIEHGLGEKLKEFKSLNLSQSPEMKTTKDFLRYSDDLTYEKDKYHYSNLGILLVGLAVEHQYNLKHATNLDYKEILKEQIEDKAGISIHHKKPKDVKFPDETLSQIQASPSGGQWMSAQDLLKFGQWMKNESKDQKFMGLMKNHGREFFFENDEIRHHGDTVSSSSSFSTFLGDELPSIVVLSDTQKNASGQAATKMYLDILNHLFPETYNK